MVSTTKVIPQKANCTSINTGFLPVFILVFAKVPPTLVDELLKHYFFYVWDDTNSIVRWMTSFNTTEQDVEEFVKTLRELAG